MAADVIWSAEHGYFFVHFNTSHKNQSEGRLITVPLLWTRLWLQKSVQAGDVSSPSENEPIHSCPLFSPRYGSYVIIWLIWVMNCFTISKLDQFCPLWSMSYIPLHPFSPDFNVFWCSSEKIHLFGEASDTHFPPKMFQGWYLLKASAWLSTSTLFFLSTGPAGSKYVADKHQLWIRLNRGQS